MSGDVFAASAIIIAVFTKRKREKRKRAEWVKPWIVRRSQLGAYDTLLSELQIEEESEYKNYLRMSPECFDELFDLVKIDITKQNTNRRDTIPPKLKLAATIRPPFWILFTEAIFSL